MRTFNKKGSKERLFEMFENVNKVKLNEEYLNNSTLLVKNFLENNGVYVDGLKIEEKNNIINISTSFGSGTRNRFTPELIEKLKEEFGEVYEDNYSDDDRGISWIYNINTNNTNNIEETSYNDLSKTNNNPSYESMKYK